jgi:peptide/nickel transport system substrate-binding protein
MPAARSSARSRARLAVPVAALATAALILSGCGSSSVGGNRGSASRAPASNASGSNVPVPAAYNNATVGLVNMSNKPGGTLRLLAQADCDSWDPGGTYYGWCWNMQRLFTRSLVGYSSIPGANNIKIEPDLAQSLGQHNANFTQWTYKLKPGVKWENGKPVTSKDVKYGVERLFATDVINGGPYSYYVATIKHPASYKGPYHSGDLASIQTPDDQTITFNLSVPYSDFDYLMALPAGGAVPAGTEGGTQFKAATYGLHPMSSGPYKIQSYTPKSSIVFARNPEWSQSTDTVRHPLADKVELTIDSDASDIGQRLLAGTADAEVDTNVDQNLQAKIAADPKLKANADDPVTGYTQYIVVNQTVKPLDNVHCRLAVFYAANKQALLQARGGNYGGSIAKTMAPPTLPGYDPNANPYPNGPNSTGDLAKAKDELKQCGQPNGFSTKIAYATAGRGPATFDALQHSLSSVGIHANGAPADSSTYYTRFIGSPSNIVSQGLGLNLAGWAADFPTGYGFWNAIANGDTILPTGNTNYASLNDPVINKILDDSTKSAGTHAEEFKKLDAQVMQDAVMLPYVYNKSLFYRNPRLTNVRCDFAVGGYYDVVNIGTSDGK